MKREQADILYSENGFKAFTTMDALYERISILASNGSYRLQVSIDNMKVYDEVKSQLLSDGYEVEDYNNGNNGILDVIFG